MTLNLNDRVALRLGRAIIYAEEMAVRLEQAEQKLADCQGASAEQAAADTTLVPEEESE